MIGEYRMYQQANDIHGQKKLYAEQSHPILGSALNSAGRDMDMDARQIGNIQDQMGHMENHIHFLMNAIDTLEKRLHPVLREEPGQPETEGLGKCMSPLASSLAMFNRRLDNASRNILSLVERLEV